jgi:hypothetical protein
MNIQRRDNIKFLQSSRVRYTLYCVKAKVNQIHRKTTHFKNITVGPLLNKLAASDAYIPKIAKMRLRTIHYFRLPPRYS